MKNTDIYIEGVEDKMGTGMVERLGADFIGREITPIYSIDRRLNQEISRTEILHYRIDLINSVNLVHEKIKLDGYHYAIPAFFSGKLIDPLKVEALSRPHFNIMASKWDETKDEHPLKRAFIFSSYLDFFLKAKDVFEIAESFGTSYQAIGKRTIDNKNVYHVLFKDGRINEIKEDKIIWDADNKDGVGLDKKWPVSQDKLSFVSEEFSNLFLLSLVSEYCENPHKNGIYRRTSDLSLEKLCNKQYNSNHIWFAFTQQYADNFKNQGIIDKCFKEFEKLEHNIGPIAERSGDYFKWNITGDEIEEKTEYLDPEIKDSVISLWKLDRRNSVLARFILNKEHLLSILNTFWGEIQIPRLKNDSRTKGVNKNFIAQFERSHPTFCIPSSELNKITIQDREIVKRGY